MDREAIKQAVRDAADHQVACATMGYDLRGVHILMEAAVDYLRVTEGMPVLADGSVLAYSAHHVYRNGEQLEIDWLNEVATDTYDDFPLSGCWPTREQSLKGQP